MLDSEEQKGTEDWSYKIKAVVPLIFILLNIKDYKFGIDAGKAILLHILLGYFCLK